MKNLSHSKSRRMFIGKLAAGTGVGLTSLITLDHAGAAPGAGTKADTESWFENAKGSHRIVYDAPEHHAGYPFIWSWVYYLTNNQTGVADNDMTAMVVLRHNAIPFAMEDRLWQKYKLGEVFQVTDNTTKKSALRNPYYEPREGDFPAPGIDGIRKLQERGAMFCVCNMALKVYSAEVARIAGLDPEEVYADWKDGVLKNIEIVPSGVWAVSRAQKHGFSYCYAGG